jgi:hypothetical protein
MSAPGLLDALRPFLWLALAAFLTGFASYAVLAGSRAAARAPAVYLSTGSAPASDAWNLPKRV